MRLYRVEFLHSLGQNENPSLAVACQLWPTADKPPPEPCSVECHNRTHAMQQTTLHGYNHFVVTAWHPPFAERDLWKICRGLPDQSALTPANFTTLPHFSVSSTMSLPKSLGEPVSAMPPRSASRAFILGSATPASISLLSLSMISTGVLLGAPMPNQPLAS